MEKSIEIPETVQAELKGKTLLVSGEKGSVEKEFRNPMVKIKKKGKEIVLSTKTSKKSEKRQLNTTEAHIKNMIKGVSKGFIYKLYSMQRHFPMRVSVKGDKVVIENFIGEKEKREANIIPGAKVEVKGPEIIVTSPDKEKAGQTAANIEKATKIRNKDRRKFSDGIYIISKGETQDEQ